MSYSFSYTESSTFTVTHARHMASKVATDLKRRLCHIAVRRVAKIRASRNNQTAATAVRHVSIAAARRT
jgi:hypothetical protein